MTYPNIAICGSLRVGKDSVAAYLCERYGYTRFAFADEMKRIARELFPHEFEGDRKPRELLQWFGETMRQRDASVWVRKLFDDRLAEIEAWEQRKRLTVITDLRLPVEYERCRAEGYVIIRVTAPDGVRIQRAIDAKDTFNYADLAHNTESHVSSFVVDYEIENSGSLAELYAKVDEVMTGIGRKKIT
ncbi:hypothetical protein PghCCS26_47600 [Paenibacillus glycanilyticus]|uniref:Dephospho-CoA kinase n=1 Tax=Paenibacillus glycanilyticus TaxID=126569 RepID=A0ABQ6NR97_9BACL|nr:adenylate kinase [Paenibacillus glycanilyticus]GMK47630.1 hypothetical protein PghCCS26_47600 [Paenibacillus glycanilyticus]